MIHRKAVRLQGERRAFLGLALTVLACQSNEDSLKGTKEVALASQEGTYAIQLCHTVCESVGSAGIAATGVLVLLDSVLRLEDLPRPRQQYFRISSMFMDSEGPFNACFVLRPVTARASTEAGMPFVDGIHAVNLSHWKQLGRDSVMIALHRSPDAGLWIIGVLQSGSLQGRTARSASGAASRHSTAIERSVVGSRVGPPDMKECLTDVPLM